MKKKIKIKVKHIIFIPIIVFILIPNLLFLIGNTMANSDIYLSSIRRDLKDFSYGILKFYTIYPKVLSPYEGEAYYNLANLKYDLGDYMATSNYYNGIRYNSLKFDTLENLNEAIDIEKKALDYKKSNSFSKNVINLLKLYVEKGDIKSGEKLVEDFLKEEDFNLKLSGEIGKLYLLHITNNKKEAKTFGEGLSKKYNNDVFNEFNYNVLEGAAEDYTFYNYDEFGKPLLDNKNKFITKALNETKLINKEIYFSEDNLKSSAFDVKSKEEYYNGKNKLKGRVTFNGEPLKYRPVIIGGSNDFVFDTYLRDTPISHTDFITYTDKDGYYEFNNIPNLKDDLYISCIIPKFLGAKSNILNLADKKIDLKEGKENIFNIELNKAIQFKEPGVKNLEGDEYTIEFFKVNNAKSYRVSLNYTCDYGNNNKSLEGVGNRNIYTVKDNKLKIPLKDGALISQYYRKPILEDDGYKYLENVGLIKEGEIVVSVEALDKDSNVINSSSNFMEGNKDYGLILKGKEKELNKGEELFLDKRFEEGVDWFLNRIKDEGFKKEYLYPLIYLSFNEENYIKKEKCKNLIEELYKINKNKSEYDYFNQLLNEKS